MFKVENKKVGNYLEQLIKARFKYRRKFCKKYLEISGQDSSNDCEVKRMDNRFKDIISGKNAIQAYDLPIVAELFDISCEMILSGGEEFGPRADRVSNYYIASCKDSKQWEEYVQREDKLILNADEYGKTAIDYALEFGNYEFLKFLMDNNYIWFDSGDNTTYYSKTFGAGTSIKPRHYNIDGSLADELSQKDSLRIKMIELAVKNNGVEMLDKLRAREIPFLYKIGFGILGVEKTQDQTIDERLLERIAIADKEIVDYFAQEFEVENKYTEDVVVRNKYMYPYLSKLIDKMIDKKSINVKGVIKKAIKHNDDTYDRIVDLIQQMQKENDEGCKETAGDKYGNPIYEEWVSKLFVDEKRNLIFGLEKEIKIDEDGLYFEPNKLAYITRHSHDIVVTNLIHATKEPKDQKLKGLVQKLNDSYQKVLNIKNEIKEIVK